MLVNINVKKKIKIALFYKITITFQYKKIIKHRNKILKGIKEWKCNKEEIDFWDDKFIEHASREEMIEMTGLDAKGILAKVKDYLS